MLKTDNKLPWDLRYYVASPLILATDHVYTPSKKRGQVIPI
jgi:hypothetical protein